MSGFWPLCRLCQRSTADGAVRGFQVDKEKLAFWFTNVNERKLLPDQIDDADLFCSFCIWRAQRDSYYNENFFFTMAWWPAKLDMDAMTQILRENFFEEKVEQCWVQLEAIPEKKIRDPAVEELHQEAEKRQWSRLECLYCGEHVDSLSKHVKKCHKDAIRCENSKCVTFFRSFQERDQHNEHVHRISKGMLTCMFCPKTFICLKEYRSHVSRAHGEQGSFQCGEHGCLSFYASESELRAHYDAAHREQNAAKSVVCEQCAYKTRNAFLLRLHVDRKHSARTLPCDACGRMFPSRYTLAHHAKQVHTFKKCELCHEQVANGNAALHQKRRNCVNCLAKLECAGLYRAHRKGDKCN